ncbi:MAG TPA: hypothetical protein VKG91_06880 [Roseiarcus sp.]|nr:hypothetical protein [Roseiarcus sp.]
MGLRPGIRPGNRDRNGTQIKGAPAIWTVVALAALALVACAAALLASKTRGLVRVLAQVVAVVAASLTGALAGFVIPLTPVARGAIGDAFWAGLLATLGTLVGMSLVEMLMARLDRR